MNAPHRAARISTSTIVVRPSSLPPAAPKATPARAPPRTTSATRGAWERSTRCRDLGQERHAGQRRDAAAQRDQQRRSARAPRARSARASSGMGRSLLALAVSNRPFEPGLTVSSPTLTLGVLALRAVVAGESPPSSCVVLRPLWPARRGVERPAAGSRRRSGRPPPRSEPLADRAADHLAAVAVLVEVGGQLVERLVQLGVGVVAGRDRCRAAVGHRVRAARQPAARAARMRPAKQMSVRLDSQCENPPRGRRRAG